MGNNTPQNEPARGESVGDISLEEYRRRMFHVLVSEECRKRLYFIARRILRDPVLADDAYQDTMMNIYRKLPRSLKLEKFDAWSNTVARNASRDVLKKLLEHRKREPLNDKFLENLPCARSSTPEDLVVDAEGRILIRNNIRRLSEGLRQVINCRYVGNLSYKEIAVLLDIQVGTVKSRLHRAHRVLRSMYEDGSSKATFRTLLVTAIGQMVDDEQREVFSRYAVAGESIPNIVIGTGLARSDVAEMINSGREELFQILAK